MRQRIQNKIKKRNGYKKYYNYYLNKIYSNNMDCAKNGIIKITYFLGNNVKHPHSIKSTTII